MKRIFIQLLATTLFVSSASYAANNTSAATQIAPTNTYLDNKWHFDIAPYLWATGMNGTVGVGSARAHLDETFSDLLSNLNIAGMIWVDAYRNNFGIFGNAMYASLSDSASDGAFYAKVKNIFAVYSAGISYVVYRKDFAPQSEASFSLEPYAGFRYTENDTSITLSDSVSRVRSSLNKNWTDPIVGLRFNMSMTKAWKLVLSGDIGGTNAASQYSYNVLGVVGYKPQTMMKNTTWYLGYRLLDQHYVTGSGINYYNWNVKISGPIASVSFAI